MTDGNAGSGPEKEPEEKELTAVELKEMGNLSVKNEKFAEAILHYSHAIKLSPLDPILYSNRSFAFLKIKQHYYANEDAETAIRLKPDWAKGYFRKGEVQLQCGQFETALLSYGKALQFQQNDMNIINAAKKTAHLSNEETMFDNRVPWVGAGVGIVVGVLIVISDQLFTQKPSLKHPTLMVFLVIVVAAIGYGISKLYRYYMRLQKRSLLDPPVDLIEAFKEQKEDEEFSDGNKNNRTRYTKAQARQRFKKGKS